MPTATSKWIKSQNTLHAKMASKLPELKQTTRLSDTVIRLLGGNPGKFTLQGTNTYIIGKGRRRLLIDTGEGKSSWSSALRYLLSTEKTEIDTVLLTHWHPDHIGGVRDVLNICPEAKIYKHRLPDDPDYYNDIDLAQKFNSDDVSLSAFFCPGHTEDHTAFILQEENAMFTGDNVLGHGTAKFEDLGVYLESLQKMLNEAPLRLYPGHGEIVDDGTAKITEYIRHRQEREDQVMQVLRSNNITKTSEAVEVLKWSSMDIVKIVYKDVPTNLHQAAHQGVEQILEKLQKEKRVKKNQGLWIAAENANL